MIDFFESLSRNKAMRPRYAQFALQRLKLSRNPGVYGAPERCAVSGST
jgi:hypothetical protein